jgi:DNA-directed RNA polymerase subunit N (RpoN/RPB10)
MSNSSYERYKAELTKAASATNAVLDVFGVGSAPCRSRLLRKQDA